jgi:hypothetical protein
MSSNFWGDTQVQKSGVETSVEVEPIPEGEIVTVILEEAKNDEYNGTETVKLALVIIDGEYKKRKVFPKLKIYDENQDKATLQRQALMWLFRITDTELPQGIPTDQDLMGMAMKQKPFKVKLGLWVIDKDDNGEQLAQPKKGNFVRAWLPVDHVEEKKESTGFSETEQIPF